jgi:hypothetical protein
MQFQIGFRRAFLIKRLENLCVVTPLKSRYQWPLSLRHRSAAAWLLGSRFPIPLGAWMFVCCVYVLCCSVQVEDSATGWSLVQRSPTVCLYVCVIKKHWKGGQRSILDYKRLRMNEWMNEHHWKTRVYKVVCPFMSETMFVKVRTLNPISCQLREGPL